MTDPSDVSPPEGFPEIPTAEQMAAMTLDELYQRRNALERAVKALEDDCDVVDQEIQTRLSSWVDNPGRRRGDQ
jgi:hypothetical protein